MISIVVGLGIYILPYIDDGQQFYLLIDYASPFQAIAAQDLWHHSLPKNDIDFDVQLLERLHSTACSLMNEKIYY